MYYHISLSSSSLYGIKTAPGQFILILFSILLVSLSLLHLVQVPLTLVLPPVPSLSFCTFFVITIKQMTRMHVYLSIIPSELISHVLNYLDICSLSTICSTLYTFIIEKQHDAGKPMSHLLRSQIEHYILLSTQSAFPCLFHMVTHRSQSKEKNGSLEAEIDFIKFANYVNKSVMSKFSRGDHSNAVVEVGNLVTMLSDENKRAYITVKHLMLFMQQFYPYAMILGKSIAIQISSVCHQSDLLSHLYYVATKLIVPATVMETRMYGLSWLSSITENVTYNTNIIKLCETIAGAAYATQNKIIIHTNTFQTANCETLTVSPNIIAICSALSQKNCLIHSITLECNVETMIYDSDTWISLIQINLEHLLQSLSAVALTRLQKFAVRMTEATGTDERNTQSKLTIAILNSISHFPLLRFEHIEICGIVLSDDIQKTGTMQVSHGVSAMSCSRRISLLHPSYILEAPTAKTPKTPKSVVRSTRKVVTSRTRRTGSFDLFELPAVARQTQNELCSYVLNKWFGNSRSIVQSPLEKLDVFDITDTKFGTIVSRASNLKKLKVHFDNAWKYVDVEKIVQIRKAMTQNESVTHVSIDTKHGNFKTSIFQIPSLNPSADEDKKTIADSMNIDDCVGFSFFKCIASLPYLKEVTIDVPFSKTFGMYNPQILSSLFETLQLKNQKLDRFRVKETPQLMNTCNTKFADHFLTVVMSYMDDMVHDRLVFKIYSTVLFQLICQAFVLRRETEHGWYYKLIHIGVRCIQPSDYHFSFILKYTQGTQPTKQNTKQTRKKKKLHHFPLLELIYCCKDISLPDLLVDEEVERVLVNVGNLARCELNTQLIKQHWNVLNISSIVKMNETMIKKVLHKR